MLLVDSFEGFLGMQQWSEPLVFDRLIAAYRKLRADDALALTRLHARVWRALIADDATAFKGLRVELVAALGRANLPLAHLAEIDAEVMAELLEVVDARFSRSQRTMKAYHLALTEIALRVRPAKARAAAA